MDRCQWKTDHLYCWKEKKTKQNQGQQRSLSGDPATLILVTHFWKKKKAALEADTNKQIYKNSSVRNPTHPFHDYIMTLCTKHKHHCPLTIKQKWKSHLHKSPCNVSNNLGWLSDIMNVTSCGHSHQINFDWLSAFQLSIKLLKVIPTMSFTTVTVIASGGLDSQRGHCWYTNSFVLFFNNLFGSKLFFLWFKCCGLCGRHIGGVVCTVVSQQGGRGFVSCFFMPVCLC